MAKEKNLKLEKILFSINSNVQPLLELLIKANKNNKSGMDKDSLMKQNQN